jgi:hypothetical protein
MSNVNYDDLPIGNKKQHLYANYVLLELIKQGYIKINNKEEEEEEKYILPIDIDYLRTFCQKEMETTLKNKMKKPNIKNTKIPVKVVYSYNDDILIRIAKEYYANKLNKNDFYW